MISIEKFRNYLKMVKSVIFYLITDVISISFEKVADNFLNRTNKQKSPYHKGVYYIMHRFIFNMTFIRDYDKINTNY